MEQVEWVWGATGGYVADKISYTPLTDLPKGHNSWWISLFVPISTHYPPIHIHTRPN